MRALRLAALPVYAAASGFLALVLHAPAAGAAAIAVAIVTGGAAAVWLSSGGWAKRERYAGRLQASVIAFALVAFLSEQTEPKIAAAVILVAVLTAGFLYVAHAAVQVLEKVRDGLVTIRGFALVEAARQTLFYATFAVPLGVGLAPGPVGAAFVAVTSCMVNIGVYRRTRRRLTTGLARTDEEPSGAA